MAIAACFFRPRKIELWKGGYHHGRHVLGSICLAVQPSANVGCVPDEQLAKSGPSGSGSYPPVNVFRKGDDLVVLIELAGIKKSGLEIQVKDNTLRIAGRKAVDYSEKASLHRRERLSGEFDRAVTFPIQIDADRAKAEYRNGMLALSLPRAERDKPKSITIS